MSRMPIHLAAALIFAAAAPAHADRYELTIRDQQGAWVNAVQTTVMSDVELQPLGEAPAQSVTSQISKTGYVSACTNAAGGVQLRTDNIAVGVRMMVTNATERGARVELNWDTLKEMKAMQVGDCKIELPVVSGFRRVWEVAMKAGERRQMPYAPEGYVIELSRN